MTDYSVQPGTEILSSPGFVVQEGRIYHGNSQRGRYRCAKTIRDLK